MIHAEKNGGFIMTSDRDPHVRIDVDTEWAPDGMVSIAAGPNAASEATLTLGELCELIVLLQKTATHLRNETGTAPPKEVTIRPSTAGPVIAGLLTLQDQFMLSEEGAATLAQLQSAFPSEE